MWQSLVELYYLQFFISGQSYNPNFGNWRYWKWGSSESVIDAQKGEEEGEVKGGKGLKGSGRGLMGKKNGGVRGKRERIRNGDVER